MKYSRQTVEGKSVPKKEKRRKVEIKMLGSGAVHNAGQREGKKKDRSEGKK